MTTGECGGGCTVFGSLLQWSLIPGWLFHSAAYHLGTAPGENQALLESMASLFRLKQQLLWASWAVWEL